MSDDKRASKARSREEQRQQRGEAALQKARAIAAGEAKPSRSLTFREQWAQAKEEIDGWKPNAAMVCPHCGTSGKIKTRRNDKTKRKVGVSGGKASAAILTGGLSLLAVGLSRKVQVTEAKCSHCNNRWEF